MHLGDLKDFSESPIEAGLATAIAALFSDFERANVRLVAMAPQEYSYSAKMPAGVAFVIPQALVDAEPARPYRVDFLFVCGSNPRTRRAYAVECDGHDWHEKTKEQAARDKRRDRHLLEIDIATVRFAGSEIHADATECAEYLRSLVHAATGTSLQRDQDLK